MSKTKSFLTIVALLAANLVLFGCGSSSSAPKEKKQKGIVLAEGDKATLVIDSDFTTITFPETLTDEDKEFYNNDVVSYLINSNGKMSSGGDEYDSSPVYYYLHNSEAWLFKGQYESPAEIRIPDVKMIKISNSNMRLREFNNLMPLLDKSKEKKNDSNYQNELLFGENRYTFIEISLRDSK